MRKRLISMMLCTVMLFTLLLAFAGCEEGLTSSILLTDAKAQTLVLAMIKDENTTDEAVKAVEDALNEITEADYNTHIVLKMYTADEYAEKIIGMSQALAAKQQAYEDTITDKRKGVIVPEEDKKDRRQYEFDPDKKYNVEANGDYTYYDDVYGMPITIYPQVKDENQLDIVFIDSIDTYYKLVNNKYVISLKSDLAANNKMNKYVNSTIFNRVRTVGDGNERGGNYGEPFAVPNNYVVSEYEYLLVNKKLFDYYQYDINCDYYVSVPDSTRCDDINDFINFLNDVAENNDKLKEEGSELYVDKLLYNFSGLRWTGYYDGGNPNGTAMAYPSSYAFATDVIPTPDSIFAKSYFKNAYGLVYDLKSKWNNAPYDGKCFYLDDKETTGFAAPAANMADNEETFAIAMVSGDRNIETYYNSDDYYVVMTNKPVADNGVFSSMFAVSTFSSTSLDATGVSMRANIAFYDEINNPRCFEIITALQTDPEVVDLLTYGVQGLNYEKYDNDPILHEVGKNGYTPILGKAGNLFMTSANDSMSAREQYYSANSWANAKAQNLGVLVSPFCGFRLSDVKQDGTEYSAVEIDEVYTEFYNEYMPKILNFNGKDDNGRDVDFDAYVKSIDTLLKALPVYKISKQAYVPFDPDKMTEEEYVSYEYLPIAAYGFFFNLVYRGTASF